MLVLSGIVEIVGHHSSGRTALALYAARNYRTLYVSCSILRHRAVPESLYAQRIRTFTELTVFVSRRIRLLASRLSIECVIIDGLDEFFYTFLAPRKLALELAHIAKNLRNLYFVHRIKVIVVNCLYTGWTVDHCTIFNPYLGLRWNYVANSRYLVSKEQDGFRLSRMDGSAFARRHFRITEAGVVPA